MPGVRKLCGFTLPCFETFCVRAAGHTGRHVDRYRRHLESCPALHPRLKVMCHRQVGHFGRHESGRYSWSNVR